MAEAISNDGDFNVHEADNILLLMAINYNNQDVVKAILHHKQFYPDKVDFSILPCALVNLPVEDIKAMLTLFKKAGLASQIANNPVYSAFAQENTDNYDLMNTLLTVHPYFSKILIERLIADGYDFMRDTHQLSPLHNEFNGYQLELMQMFIDAGYDVNALRGFTFPLRASINSPGFSSFY